MKFNNSVDIVFSSGILLVGAAATLTGSAICYEVHKWEYPETEQDPNEPHDAGAEAPFVLGFIGAKILGYGLGGSIALGGLGIATIGFNSLSKAIIIRRNLKKIKFDIRNMSTSGYSGIGIGISFSLN